jgi:hypothetical protein
MKDTRRGFLKTLGKLGAAVGLTAAVASTPGKAPTSTAPKAKGQIRYASNVCVTNRPDVSKAVEMTSRHQEWLNRMTVVKALNTVPNTMLEQKEMNRLANQMMDNINMRIYKSVVLEDITG